MSAYCDTSAVVKLILDEGESAAFRDWSRNQDALLISRIGVLELERAVLRAGGRRALLEPVLQFIDVIPISDAALRAAGSVGSPTLRAVDALHIATALAAVDTTRTFVTYDRRQAESASSAGLDVVSPS